MQTDKPTAVNLIADIGGTNIRLALADDHCEAKFIELATYQCKNFSNLAEVIALYIHEKQLNNCQINACFAIACPVDNDLIVMTNLPWQFSQQQLKQQLNLTTLTCINDYTAIALAIPLLTEQQKVKIGGGAAVANKPISICGPGTGLGVAHLVPITISEKMQWVCFGGEGGHVDFAAVSELEQQVLNYLKKIKQRVSYEQLLSGYGLEQIHQGLHFIKQGQGLLNKDKLSAEDISARALNKQSSICQQTLTLFCNVLGSFAGNLALTMNSQSGVYIAGGIVPHFIDYLKTSDFRQRFQTKGRLSYLNESIPTYVITESQPGLLGAAAFLLQK